MGTNRQGNGRLEPLYSFIKKEKKKEKKESEFILRFSSAIKPLHSSFFVA